MKLTYSDCTNWAETKLRWSGWFKTNRGMRLGSVFSEVLLNAMVDEIANKLLSLAVACELPDLSDRNGW